LAALKLVATRVILAS